MRAATTTAVVCALVVASCATDSSTSTPSTVQPKTVATQPSSTSTSSPETAEYLENFEFVWTTIDEEFYDPDFGGVNWEGIHDQYLPEVTAATDDNTFLEMMNEMLFELGVSHLFVVPPEAEFIDPVLTIDGELGIQVRLLDAEWVITTVEPGSPAAASGLRPGYLLDSIAGENVTDIAASAILLPPAHERGTRSSQILAVEERLYGEPGTETTVAYHDAVDEPQQVTLTFQQRGASAELIPGFPPVFTTLEVDVVEGGFGYIRFDPFAPALATPILEAIESMRDAPGLIFDVRGNHGGASDVGTQLIDNLIDQPAAIWTWSARDGSETTYAEPSDNPYDGPVVVLVDVVSGSAAEAFAGGIQALGRAVVAGERTAGRLLGGEIAELPIGAIMIYPVVELILADGTIVEGRGLIPDLPVNVHRSDLLEGVDPALQAAIEHLQSPDG